MIIDGNECFHSAISDQIFGGTPASPPIQVGPTRLAPKSHLASGKEIGKGTKIVVSSSKRYKGGDSGFQLGEIRPSVHGA